MVTNVGTENPEDDVLGDVGGVIGNALQVACNEQCIQRLLSHLWTFIHGSHEHNECFVSHAIDNVIHLEYGLRELRFAIDKRFQCSPDHGADRGCHARNVYRQVSRWELDHVHDTLGDIDSLIADTLEVRVDFRSEEHTSELQSPM